VSGASKQDGALEVGDKAYASSTSQTYQCTVATLGGATWTTPTDDSDAIHDDEAGEINALTTKVYPEASDPLIIEDAADSFNKKSILVDDLPTGAATDPDAIHDNVAAEISALTQKTVPVFDDLVLIEDSEASHAKKKAKLINIPRPLSRANLWYPPSSPHSEDDEFIGSLDASWYAYNFTTENIASFVTGVDAYDGSYSGDDLRYSLSRKSWILLQPGVSKTLLLAKSVTFSTNMLIVARLKFNQYYSSMVSGDRYCVLHIGSYTGGEPNKTDYMVVGINYSPSSGVAQGRFYEREGNVTGFYSATTNVVSQGQALEYAAIHKIGTTYHGWLGTAGGNWIYMGSASWSPTPAFVGVQTRVESTTLPGLGVFGVDFIRFLETDNFLF